MAIARVTQNMMMRQSMAAIEANSSRLAQKQEEMSTGRRLTRASDSPSEAITAMRVRAEKAALQQHARNADDGLGWLNQIDASLMSMSTQVRRARDLALQGANDGAMGDPAREALAIEVDQLRAALVSAANADFLGRPVFGGITAGSEAYAADGSWQGTAAPVNRTIAPGVQVQVNVNGPEVFGPDGDSLFDDLTALAEALRANDSVAIGASIGKLDGRLDALSSTLADVGVRAKRLEGVLTDATAQELALTSRLSDIEDIDLTRTALEVKLSEVAYQSALATSARVLSTSLLDFLR